MSKEKFMQAATRHLIGSKILLDHAQLDNAVYLAGYTVECTLKGYLGVYIKEPKVRTYSHDIKKLHKAAFTELYILYPQLFNEIHSLHKEIEKVAEGHPERRYWASSYYSLDTALQIIETSESIYKKTIPSLLLDGRITLEEV